MSAESRQGMIDILMLETTVENSDLSLLTIILSSLLILSIIFFILQYYKKPLRCLRRQLHREQITAREVANLLAHSTRLNVIQTKQLEKIRFAKAKPTSQQILYFMNTIE